MSLEEIEIEGFIGQNPKYTSTNYPDMLCFSVGVTQSNKDKDTNEWKSITNWYNVVSWNKTKSEYIFKHAFKGDKVVVKGRPSARSYTDKDGVVKSSISVNLEKIVLMKKAGGGEEAGSYEQNEPQSKPQASEDSTTAKMQRYHDSVRKTSSDHVFDNIPF